MFGVVVPLSILAGLGLCAVSVPVVAGTVVLGWLLVIAIFVR